MVLLAPHDSAGHWSYKFEAVAVPYLRLSAFICGSNAVDVQKSRTTLFTSTLAFPKLIRRQMLRLVAFR